MWIEERRCFRARTPSHVQGLVGCGGVCRPDLDSLVFNGMLNFLQLPFILPLAVPFSVYLGRPPVRAHIVRWPSDSLEYIHSDKYLTQG